MRGKPKEQNGLLCTNCNTFLPAPEEQLDYVRCKCQNRAWIQRMESKTPYFAYGALDHSKYQRIKPNGQA